MSAPGEATATKEPVCSGCGVRFVSGNQLYKHLRQSGQCQEAAASAGLVLRPAAARVKVIAVVGYLSDRGGDAPAPVGDSLPSDDDAGRGTGDPPAAAVRQNGRAPVFEVAASGWVDRELARLCGASTTGYSRCTSTQSRTSVYLSQSDATPAAADVVCLPLPDDGTSYTPEALNASLPPRLRVFACAPASGKKFHAELACTSRRYDYIVPLAVLAPDLVDLTGPLRGAESAAAAAAGLLGGGAGGCTDEGFMAVCLERFSRLKAIGQRFQVVVCCGVACRWCVVLCLACRWLCECSWCVAY